MQVDEIQAYFLDTDKYPHPVDDIEFIETHISVVCLTGQYVYKIKKPVEMGGILDFTELAARQRYCQREVELNSRFSPELYLGVVTLTPHGISDERDQKYEHAIKMKQLPQSAVMQNQIEQGIVPNDETVSRLVDKLVTFYQSTSRQPQGGSIQRIGEKIDENFETLAELGWSHADYQDNVYSFLSSRTDLFEQRQQSGKIVDGHGDLRPRNIFILEDDVNIFDCIEFNDLLRYVDIAEDIAFLLMELDMAGLNKSSTKIKSQFTEMIDDPNLHRILPFYQSYRAAVRTKVKLFRCTELDETEDIDEIKSLQKQADRYGKLAINYMEDLV